MVLSNIELNLRKSGRIKWKDFNDQHGSDLGPDILQLITEVSWTAPRQCPGKDVGGTKNFGYLLISIQRNKQERGETRPTKPRSIRKPASQCTCIYLSVQSEQVVVTPPIMTSISCPSLSVCVLQSTTGLSGGRAAIRPR